MMDDEIKKKAKVLLYILPKDKYIRDEDLYELYKLRQKENADKVSKIEDFLFQRDFDFKSQVNI